MKIFRSLADIPKFNKAVYTQGTFDGLHPGHQIVIRRIVETARKIGGESVLLTFFPHPRLFLYPEDNELRLLQTLDEKIASFEALGLDNLIILPFDKAFSSIEPAQFVQNFLVNTIGVSVIVVGYDHRFGHNREGDISLLRKIAAVENFTVEEIAVEDMENIAISSTRIREALKAGDVETAAKYLGRPYSFSGVVVHGRKLGRELGYPTANLELTASYKLIPSLGIYAVKAEVGGKTYGGMLSIGKNPTIIDKGFSIEVNLFNFAKDIYGEEVRIYFIAYLRKEEKYDNLEALSQQLKLDKIYAEKILAHL
ncbi:MAG: bifunctional riboflavin kinase/FAD synthetase [Bacteroidia bacterium]|nr:bifunctional riboflavin kinase/FAD synthetase [Bacteroidia bacterium]